MTIGKAGELRAVKKGDGGLNEEEGKKRASVCMATKYHCFEPWGDNLIRSPAKTSHFHQISSCGPGVFDTQPCCLIMGILWTSLAVDCRKSRLVSRHLSLRVTFEASECKNGYNHFGMIGMQVVNVYAYGTSDANNSLDHGTAHLSKRSTYGSPGSRRSTYPLVFGCTSVEDTYNYIFARCSRLI